MVHVCFARALTLIIRSTQSIGRNITHQKSHKVEFSWKLPPRIHWTIPVNIHGKSDNPLESTTDKYNYVGKCHCTSIGDCN